MKRYLSYIIFFCILGCTHPIEDTYKGYIYMNKEPLKGIKVLEENTNNHTFTNEEGYFALRRENLTLINNLIVEINNSKDTIELLRGGGIKNTYYLCLRKDKDTIDLHHERILKNQTKYRLK